MLLSACPFLSEFDQQYWDCGDTITFGDVGQWTRDGTFNETQSSAVFQFFNILAETGDDNAVEVLATGALECFNDDAHGQRLARRNLRGPALKILEEMRIWWGQPDYGLED